LGIDRDVWRDDEDGSVATTRISGASATHEEAAVTAIKQTVTIQPGGRVEVISDELPEGRQAEVIILVDHFRPTHHSADSIEAGQGPPPDIQTADQPIDARRDVEGSEPEELPQEYPTADFIKPTEYDWNMNVFLAERAVREYLKDSHADH
jgi:hypothetical protein